MAFPDTRWTLVRAARSADIRRRALDELLTLYWPPAYAYARRRGLDPEDAEEVVQELFASLLGPDVLARADPSRGRLRSWLIGGLEHVIAHRREARTAKKRGGGAVAVSLDTETMEAWLASDAASPEEAFTRAWADGVLRRALARLEAETEPARYALLARIFGAGDVPAYRDLAAEAGMSVPQLKSFVFRSRGRLRTLALEEIRETVATPEEAERELAELLGG